MDRTPLTFGSRRPSAHGLYRTLLIVALSSIMALVFMDVALAQEVEPAAVDLADISQQLSLELETTDGPVTFLVVLKDQLSPDEIEATSALQAANADSITREARIATSYHALTSHAKSSQSSLRAWLDEQEIAYRPFYIVNMIEVTGDATLADALRRRPEVDRLIGNPQVDSLRSSMAPDDSFAVDAPWLTRLASPEAAQSQALPYGLRDTDAVEVWTLGYTGQGITVASQDTGVQWDHPALQSRYRGWHGEGAAGRNIRTTGSMPGALMAVLPIVTKTTLRSRATTMATAPIPSAPCSVTPPPTKSRSVWRPTPIGSAVAICDNGVGTPAAIRLFRVFPGALSSGRRSI